jgi:hypothetical protein
LVGSPSSPLWGQPPCSLAYPQHPRPVQQGVTLWDTTREYGQSRPALANATTAK